MNQTTAEVVAGVVRHLVTVGGGYAIGAGLVSESDVGTFATAAATIAAIGWSAFQKWSKNRRAGAA